MARETDVTIWESAVFFISPSNHTRHDRETNPRKKVLRLARKGNDLRTHIRIYQYRILTGHPLLLQKITGPKWVQHSGRVVWMG